MTSDNDVLIWDNQDICHTGRIKHTPNGPIAVLKSGRTVTGDNNSTYYEMKYEIVISENGARKKRILPKPIKIYLKPDVLRYRSYAKDKHLGYEDIFPPSSGNGWYGRMIYGEKSALYII